MSFSLSARKLLTVTGLFGITALACAAGCAAPSEDVDTSGSALNDNGESYTNDVTGWTSTVSVTKHGTDVTASFEADSNGQGGSTFAGVCVATDLGLGKCDTVADCEAAAEAVGIPHSATSLTQAHAIQHYCIDAGSEGQKRCWTRPGAAGYNAGAIPQNCVTRRAALDGQKWSVTRSATTDTNSDPELLAALADATHWTAVGCLGSGAVFDPTQCGPQPYQQVNFNFADHFITVK